MKRDVKKIFVFCLFSIILIGFIGGVLAAPITSTDASSTTTASTSLGDKLAESSNWFTKNLGLTLQGWTKGNLDKEALKWLYFALLAVLVYSILGVIGMFKEQIWVRWIIGVLVGFIATAYMTPDQVWAIGQEYSIFGLSLGIFLPFVILFFFSFEVGKEGSPDGMILQWIMWLIFAGFLLVRLLIGATEITPFQGQEGYYLFVVFLAALTMLIFNSFLIKKIGKKTIESVGNAANMRRRLATHHERGEAEAERELAEGSGSGI